MGCSPSKGKLFSKPDISAPQTGLQAEAPQGVDCGPEEGEDVCLKPEEKDEELLLLADKHTTEPTRTELDSDTTAAREPEKIRESEVTHTPRETTSDVKQEDKIKTKGSQRKNRHKKRAAGRQRRSLAAPTKVDFPPQMVRAHQAAYTFLNPNISKYKTLLGLLEQAAHTHMSLQPMMTALVFQFEEINQALEEMAEEGELMLREHGDYMALPSGMLGNTMRTTTVTTSQIDPPPDLVQQLLQHSAGNMKQVGGSVKALGDTALQEAVDYFFSLSKLMLHKLEAKQAAELRLAGILAQVEGAAVWKPNAEDAALHSEDSGIGGENESVTGSVKHHRGSAGSCGSGANIQSAGHTYPDGLANPVGHDEDDEEEEEEEEQEEEEDRYSRPERKRSNSSPPDPSRAFHYLNGTFLQDQQLTAQRPLTAADPELSSALQKSPREENKNTPNVSEIQGTPESGRPHLYRCGQKRHSLNGSAGAYRSPVGTNRTLPSLTSASRPPQRPSVRRLISTFSQGVSRSAGQRLPSTPPHVRRSNKSQVLLVSDAGHGTEGWFGGRSNNNSWPEGRDDLDMDNLPPPPLEVLMDDSFQSDEGRTQNEEGLQGDSLRSLPMIHQRAGNYPQRKIPLQNLQLLPNRANVRSNTVTMTPTQPAGQEAAAGTPLEPDPDAGTEKANSLYQQARKIIHLRNAAESSDRTKAPRYPPSASVQVRVGQRFDSNETCECETSSCNLPVIAPPVSRVRLPPSGPPVCHRYPSPPVFRPGPTSRPTSRPCSPRATTSARDNPPEEIVPSVSFKNARSFFCQNESQNSQTCISSRGRRLSRGPDISAHRTQSETRPAGSSHPDSGNSRTLVSFQAKGSDAVFTK